MDNTNTSQLDAVKDIIFGQNIKEYNEQIAKLEAQIQENQANVTKKIEDLKNNLMNAIATTEQNLIGRLEALKEASQQEFGRQDNAHLTQEDFSNALMDIAKTFNKTTK